MITLDEIGEKRIEAKMDRGPWPSEQAVRENILEIVKELSDAYEHARIKADSPWKDALLEHIEDAFAMLQNDHGPEIEKLFGGK